MTSPKPNLSRGEFLKVAALAVASLFLKACAKLGLDVPTETSTPTQVEVVPTSPPEETAPTTEPVQEPMEQDMTGKVAFVKTDDRISGVQRAIDLLGINPVEGKHVFLKPNFNSADPAPGSTHPDVLRAMILKMLEMGAVKITLGDRSGMGDSRRVMERIGVFPLAEELGFDVIVFDELGAEDWVLFNPAGTSWKKGFYFPRPAVEADVIVQTCCLKTHRYGGHFTMSLKNSVGLAAKTVPGNSYNYMDELHTSSPQRRMIAELNAVYEPGLIVMDGVKAFRKGGPATGTVTDSQVVLAGTDRIAIDAVGVALLRYYGTTSEVEKGRVFEQEQIARAVELELGVDAPEKINLITDDPDSAAYAEEIREVLVR